MKLTKKDIYQETRYLLLNGGYDRLSFAKLASTLGVTRPALYKHYKNKDELIMDFMVDEMTNFVKEFEEVSQHLTSETFVSAVMEQFLEFSTLHQMMESLYRVNYKEEPALSQKMKELRLAHDNYAILLENLLNNGKEEGVFSKEFPNKLLSQFIMAAINTLSSDASQEELEMLEKMIMRGIGTLG